MKAVRKRGSFQPYLEEQINDLIKAVNNMYERIWEVGSIRVWPWSDLPKEGFDEDHGWLWLDGRTIGDALSGATALASANSEALFIKIWTDYTDVTAPIQTSAGEASTRGASALADWEEHKRITLTPDTRGRVLIGMDDYGYNGGAADRITDVNADILGGTGGEETHALTSNENGPHTHTGGVILGLSGVGGNGGNWVSGTGNTGSSGIGTPHNNLQPWTAVKYIIRY
jgi:hypothetical protein